MTMNQISMTGPNMPPMNEVPLRCTMKRAMRMTTVMGTTKRSRCGAYTLMPSMALNTEIAGVIAPSP